MSAGDFTQRHGEDGDAKVSARREALISATFDCGMRIHKRLGPGLFETVYEALLFKGLLRSGLNVERQRWIDIVVDGITIPNAFRADLLIEDLLLVEVKAVETRAPVHLKQLLTYLRVLDMRVGIIANFGQAVFHTGMRRAYNPRCVSASS